MDIPSPGRIMVELQKAATGVHRLLLQSPLGPLVSTTPFGRFLILHTTGRRSGQPRRTPLSYTRDGATYIVIASDGGSPAIPTGTSTSRMTRVLTSMSAAAAGGSWPRP